LEDEVTVGEQQLENDMVIYVVFKKGNASILASSEIKGSIPQRMETLKKSRYRASALTQIRQSENNNILGFQCFILYSSNIVGCEISMNAWFNCLHVAIGTKSFFRVPCFGYNVREDNYTQ
jgi:hypothetical protein